MREARLDKFLWSIRLFKTRSIAAEACKSGKIFVNQQVAKSSKMVKAKDCIEVKKDRITYSYQVLQIPPSRVGAKLVSEYITNITSKEDLELLELHKLNRAYDRKKGTGRPTKKERRALSDFLNIQ